MTFKVAVITQGDLNFSTNSVEYDDKQDARQAAIDLYSRWGAVSRWVVLASDVSPDVGGRYSNELATAAKIYWGPTSKWETSTEPDAAGVLITPDSHPKVWAELEKADVLLDGIDPELLDGGITDRPKPCPECGVLIEQYKDGCSEHDRQHSGR